MQQASGSAWRKLLTDNWLKRNALTASLWPLSQLFGLLVRLRLLMFRLGWHKTNRFAATVIVIGNVVAGGVGKTPVVISLARHLSAKKYRLGVVSRGYGRQTSGCIEVLLDSPPALAGDEPALIKRTLSGGQSVPVFVAEKREEAVRALLELYPETQMILCDDGLQHYALQRDIEVCVFDDRGIGNGCLLPAGPLREPWPRKVDFILNTGHQPVMTGYTSKRKLSDTARLADGREVALAELVQPGKPLLALAGIAHPQTFFAMLRAYGLTLDKTIALPDHYDFNSWVRPIDKGYTLICTEKDAVKLWLSHPDALAVRLDCILEPAFLEALDQLLSPPHHPSLSSSHGHSTT